MTRFFMSQFQTIILVLASHSYSRCNFFLSFFVHFSFYCSYHKVEYCQCSLQPWQYS